MNCYIYKLNFTTPVHFGERSLADSTTTCRADTLFSAICISWMKAFGNIDDLIEGVNKDEFILSDTFPYIENELYVTKPIIYLERDKNIKEKIDKKEMKSIKFIPLNKFQKYIKALKKGDEPPFDYKRIKFSTEEVVRKVSIKREEEILDNGNIKQSEPYTVSVQRFEENCGLYFILKTNEDLKDKLDIALDVLSTVGLGGKRSLGYGKFEFESFMDKEVEKMISGEGDYYMNLTTFLPKREDLSKFDREKSTYMLVERSGFVESMTYSKGARKKKPVVMFASGSCFDKKLEGQLIDVSYDYGNHPVYKYGKPLFMGVRV